MNIHIYIWKNNQEQLSQIQNRGELINKLLQLYFDRKAKEYVTEKEL